MYDPAKEQEEEERRQKLRLTVRRIDRKWHVCAVNCEVEYTHSHAFKFWEDAEYLMHRVKAALVDGRELNLAHWWASSLH